MNAQITRKTDQFTTNMEKKTRTLKRQAKRGFKRYIVLFGIIAGALTAIGTLNGLNAFYNQYELYFRSPFRNPIVFNKRIHPTPTPTIAPTPRVIPKKQGFDYKRIHSTLSLLESTNGTKGHALYCKNKGMVNTIGYNPQAKFCFKSKEDEMNKVYSWYQDKFEKGYTLAEASCMWNLGKKLDSCEYSQKVLALVNY